MQTVDVIVIGGGFLGLSTAYQLARSGVKTLLLEAGDLGSGSSCACSGRAQVCEGHLYPLNTSLIRESLKKFDTLEEELAFEFEWRRVLLVLLIRSQKDWNLWVERSAALTAAGIQTDMMDLASLQKAEPHLNTESILGAACSVEGMLNPLRFIHAYASAAARHGAQIRGRSAVVGMEVKGRRITAVKTASDTFYADKVAVMAGAWEAAVGRLAGVDIPIRHAHAETMATEAIPQMIHSNVALSDTYDTIHGKARGVTVGIHPEPNGTLNVAESVTRTDELHQRVGVWGIKAMAREMVKLYPFLSRVRITRTWARPTSFTPDEEPLIGWMPPLDNMFIATSLMQTITSVPLMSEWMSMMIQGQEPPVSLEMYSPARPAALKGFAESENHAERN